MSRYEEIIEGNEEMLKNLSESIKISHFDAFKMQIAILGAISGSLADISVTLAIISDKIKE